MAQKPSIRNTSLNFLNLKIPLVLLLVVIAAGYVYHNHIVTSKNEEITNYEQQIKDGSRALWKYFKDISELKIRQIVDDVMKSAADKQEHLLAVQIYEYSVKHLKYHTLITVHNRYGYASESTDLNALQQLYYRIPKSLYDEYVQVLLLKMMR